MDNSDEIARLRRAFDRLPKSGSHGRAVTSRHPDMRPEWIMSIIENPYDEWVETDDRTGQNRTVIAGRVPQFRQWIKLVFVGIGDTRELLTAYPDKRLSRKYGGRPWRDL